MKKLRIAVLLVTVISLLGLILACPAGETKIQEVPGPEKETPVLADYDVTPALADININEPVAPRTAAAKDPSKGLPPATVNYDGSTNPSSVDTSKAGSVTITLKVGSNEKYNATEIYVGKFYIIDNSGTNPGVPRTPTIDDFNISALPKTVGFNTTPVLPPAAGALFTITAKTAGYSPTISYKYRVPGASTTTPGINTNIEAGALYNVEIDVQAVTGEPGWADRTDLFVGTITVLPKVTPPEPPPPAEEEVTILEFSDLGFEIIYADEDASFTAENGTASAIYSGKQLDIKVVDKIPAAGTLEPFKQPYPSTYPSNYGELAGSVRRTVIFEQDVTGGGRIPVTNVVNFGTYYVTVEIADVVRDAVGTTPKRAWKGVTYTFTLNIVAKRPRVGDYYIGNLRQAEAGTLLDQTNTYKVKHIEITAKTTPNGNPLKEGIASNGAIRFGYKYVPNSHTWTPADYTAATPDAAALETKLRADWTGSLDFAQGLSGQPTGGTPADNPPQKQGKYIVTFSVAQATDSGTTLAVNWTPAATGTDTGRPLVAAGDPADPDNMDDERAWTLVSLDPVKPVIKTENIFWVDEVDGKTKLEVTQSAFAIVPPKPVHFEAKIPVTAGYTIVKWLENGKEVKGDDGELFTDPIYTFEKTAVGRHDVTLVVKDAANRMLSETAIITVQPQH